MDEDADENHIKYRPNNHTRKSEPDVDLTAVLYNTNDETAGK